MFHKIKKYVVENEMLEEHDKVIVGVSGGADSVCLFFILLELQQVYHLSLFVVHVNHGLRGNDAKKDELFVKNLCDTHRIPYKVFSYQVERMAKTERMSSEEMGRKLRYQAFEQVCKEYQAQKIAVAHNKNDQCETVLLNLFRGSGLRGMTGIAPVRGNIIRPLLIADRTEIESYLQKNKIAYCMDASNLTQVYTRNKIRLSVLPFIESEINHHVCDHIAKTAGMLKEVEEYIKRNGRIAKEKIVRFENGKYFLEVEKFLLEDTVIQKEVLRMVIAEMTIHLKDIEAEHISMLQQLAKKQVGKEIQLPYHIVAKKTYDEIEIFIRLEEKAHNNGSLGSGRMEPRMIQNIIQIHDTIGREEIIPKIEVILSARERIKNQEIPKNSCTKWFDYAKIANTVTLRHRQEGDFLQIDQQGKRKKLNRILIDDKVPKEQRDSLFLLADGSHVIWIIGDRISQAYKVDENTKNILIVNVDGGTLNVE